MRRRLVLSYLGIAVFVLLILELPLAIVYGDRERERLETGAQRDALVMTTFFEDALEAGSSPDPAAAERYARRTGARVVVVDAGGTSVLDTADDPGRDFSTRPEIRSALAGRTVSGTRASQTLGHDLLYVTVPIASGGIVHGAVRITVDAGDVAARVHGFWLGLAGVAGVVLVVVTAVAVAEARSLTRPLRELEVAVERFGRGDLAEPETGDIRVPELAAMRETIATMAARLRQLLEEQERFVADASHQLRTPLTALRLRLENLRSHLDEEAAGEVDLALDEIDRLAALVVSLLRLARASEQRERVDVDVAALAEERVSTWTALAELEEVQIDLDVDRTSGALVARTVPGAVEQILDNLLENALEVAPHGSAVTVAVAREGRTVHLEVRDEGPGLTEEQRRHAPERFWRGSPGGGGTGLGLSIVASLASASGGRLLLGAVEPHGLAARVELPVTGATA